MEDKITFKCGDLTLSGTMHTPDGGANLPTIIVLHGFGSNSNSANVKGPVKMLNDWGYGAFRFDMPGCGESDGEFGRVICQEQVEATQAALTYLQSRPEIDPDRIGVLGSSFGAAVAIYAGGVDKRFACVVSSGGWGHGERKFRGQHPTKEGWMKFTNMLEAGRRHREKTGESLMVDRYDIVPIPEHLRNNLSQKSVEKFPAEVPQSMYNFTADDVVGDIAPRPLLLLHSSDDSVTPTEQSVALFQKAGQPTDLHLFAETDHFMFAENNTRVREIIKSWLDKFFPVSAAAKG
jgi:pimeloyl-ACP methyl ester carboxylesterase